MSKFDEFDLDLVNKKAFDPKSNELASNPHLDSTVASIPCITYNCTITQKSCACTLTPTRQTCTSALNC